MIAAAGWDIHAAFPLQIARMIVSRSVNKQMPAATAPKAELIYFGFMHGEAVGIAAD
jgi:hypothetical protein